MQQIVSDICPLIQDCVELRKGLKRIGLTLSESQFQQLCTATMVSLEEMELAEVGSTFILAAAVSGNHLERKSRKITFADLVKFISNAHLCSGLPISCWSDQNNRSNCLYLTLIGGKLALCVYPQNHGLIPSSNLER